MVKIFKTPTDDSTEATLRAMHTQNTIDTYYEYGLGWLRTILFTSIAILVTSAYELSSEISIWENTVEWFWDKLTNWVLGD